MNTGFLDAGGAEEWSPPDAKMASLLVSSSHSLKVSSSPSLPISKSRGAAALPSSHPSPVEAVPGSPRGGGSGGA